jgi:hypothetical protein
MRGGAQAHLIECSDGNHYVVKFLNNPQHRRVLVNEWIATRILEYLQLNTAVSALVEIDHGFIAREPMAGIQRGSVTEPPTVGWHFGSRYPGDPLKTAVYDFLPDLMLSKVANATDFPALLCFDQWIGNSDSRQAVFYRANVLDSASSTETRRFVALWIDHGYVFAGPEWALRDSGLLGLYHRPLVYSGVTGWAAFEPWIERLRNLPDSVLDAAMRDLPMAWIETDREELESLLDRLIRRKDRVPALIEAVRDSHRNPFPAWK